jgi:CRISPR-associated endonuclease/helicase Cas3
VPIWALRQWCVGEASKGLLLESDEMSMEPDVKAISPERPLFAVCWRGLPNSRMLPEDRSFVLNGISDLNRLRGGDVLILSDHASARFWLLDEIAGKDRPSDWLDIGDRVQFSARGRPTLRIHKALESLCVEKGISNTDELDWPAILSTWLAADEIEGFLDDRDHARKDILAILSGLGKWAYKSDEHRWLGQTCSALHQEISDLRRFERSVHQPLKGCGFVIRSGRRYRLSEDDQEDDPMPDDSFSSSRGADPVLLSDHCNAVAERAAHYAKDAGLAEGIVNAFHLAGLLHDVGKADPRFQAMLIANSPGIVPDPYGALAKSALMAQSLRDVEARREAAGYPKGGRHELLSTRLVESAEAFLGYSGDRDLVLHLIASHHGHCRPFAPIVDDKEGQARLVNWQIDDFILSHHAASGLERLDSGVSERFWRLQARFGAWGLAWLEALFRLADQTVSGCEQTRNLRA